MPVVLSTSFVLLVILIAYNRWGDGNWFSSAVAFMLACSLSDSAWFALGRQAGDTTRDVVVSTGTGIQSGIGGGASGAVPAQQQPHPEANASIPPATR